MLWVSAFGESPVLEEAVEYAAGRVRVELAGKSIDLVLAFLSRDFHDRYAEFPEMLQMALPHHVLIGCSAREVIGDGREGLGAPGLSLTAAHIPGSILTATALHSSDLPDMDAPRTAWQKLLDVPPEPVPSFLVFADPFTFHPGNILSGLDYAYPSSPKLGGLAGGARKMGGNALFLGNETRSDGIVLLAMAGNVEMRAEVVQGCRPVGDPMRVTRCDGGLLIELDGRSPLETIPRLLGSLPDRNRKAGVRDLMVGVQQDSLLEEAGAGSYLIRALMGQDPETGAMLVGETLRPGQMIRFHLRDKRTARVGLAKRLARIASEDRASRNRCVLLFPDEARGEGLYGEPETETRLVREHLGDLPLGGFYCGGALGPVAGATHLHGMASAFAVIRPKKTK
ncbi:MAG: FIST C-terminal domain-containing protein [Candidatus Eisenbacteria bacterium]|nr:FIST C-terminal domain-containing protein [Candidatus Eisenbacteria bacterium]